MIHEQEFEQVRKLRAKSILLPSNDLPSDNDSSFHVSHIDQLLVREGWGMCVGGESVRGESERRAGGSERREGGE